MGTPRVVTFLLGAWLAVSLLLDIASAVNLSQADDVLRAPPNGATEIVRAAGPEQARLLLRYFANEQNRYLFDVWELAQFPLALLVAGLLFYGLDRRPLPLILCGVMLAIVLAQYLVITPEMKFRGRETDFPAPSAVDATGIRSAATNASGAAVFGTIFAGSEIAKIAAGGYLAGYLFFFRSRRRKRNHNGEAEELARANALRARSTPR